MNASKLIEIASAKGYAIGRNKPGEYRYGAIVNGTMVEKAFTGTWPEFVRFIKDLPSAK